MAARAAIDRDVYFALAGLFDDEQVLSLVLLLDRNMSDAKYDTSPDLSTVDLSGTESPIPGVVHDGTYIKAGLEEFYVPIEKFEGRHRYDPSFAWDPSDERRLVRKVTPPLALLRRFVVNSSNRSTGGYALGSASRSLLCNWIEATLLRHFQTTCSTISSSIPTTTTME